MLEFKAIFKCISKTEIADMEKKQWGKIFLMSPTHIGAKEVKFLQYW